MALALEPPELTIQQREPFNAGPPLRSLVQRFTTPNWLFFSRNHGTLPKIDREDFRLSVGGRVGRSIDLPLDDLRRLFPERTVTATLQCAGNRRREFATVRPVPGELQWGPEAVGTAEWAGIALKDVLEWASPDPDAAHVGFTSLGVATIDDARVPFGASIPIRKALSPEVLLAYEMNGELLPPVHGGPLRAVVPGYVGARSVKWLSRVEVLVEPSSNPFQAVAYKVPANGGDRSIMGRSPAGPLGDLGVTSAICVPDESSRVPPGTTEVRGYAYAGGGRHVVCVEVSADGGRSFIPARFQDAPSQWAWRRWSCEFELEPGSCELVARAIDSSGAMQPERVSDVWNPKGYANNAWHRVHVLVTR